MLKVWPEEASPELDALELAPRLCVRLCLRKSQFLRNTLPHWEQLYGLMSVWVRRWVFRLERWLKDLLHTGHLCGDSSMWRILWTARVRDWQKPLPHSVHLKGFSLLWIYLEWQKIIISNALMNLYRIMDRYGPNLNFFKNKAIY